VSPCAEWILSFVQEMDVRTDLERGWFYPAKSLPEFIDLRSKDWSYIQFFFCLLREFDRSPLWLAYLKTLAYKGVGSQELFCFY